MFKWIKAMVWPEVTPSPRTTDGGHLAPYPGMTDEDLADYEHDMKVPNPTFPRA